MSKKAKVIIEGRTKHKSFSALWLDPKTVFENYSCPQNSSLGPQKAKTTPKLSQNQISELKET